MATDIGNVTIKTSAAQAPVAARPTSFRTAVVLGRYRRELLDEGIPGDLVRDLLRSAAQELINRAGLVVKSDG